MLSPSAPAPTLSDGSTRSTGPSECSCSRSIASSSGIPGRLPESRKDDATTLVPAAASRQLQVAGGDGRETHSCFGHIGVGEPCEDAHGNDVWRLYFYLAGKLFQCEHRLGVGRRATRQAQDWRVIPRVAGRSSVCINPSNKRAASLAACFTSVQGLSR